MEYPIPITLDCNLRILEVYKVDPVGNYSGSGSSGGDSDVIAHIIGRVEGALLIELFQDTISR